MDINEQIQNLTERIQFLEQKLASISLNEAKEVTFNSCPIGDITVGADCKLDFHNSSFGAVIDADGDDAEDRVDDLECRLDEINARIDEAESRLDEMDND